MDYRAVFLKAGVGAFFAAWVLAGGLLPAHAVSSGHREELIVTTVPYKSPSSDLPEKQVRISGVLWVPNEGRTPHPLAIYSHGSQSSTGVGTYSVEASQFAAFLDRGYAVFAPMRKGFNRNGTPLSQAKAAETEPLPCSAPEEGLQSAVSDSKALIAALQSARRSDIDFRNITLFGHSRGGMVSLALAADGLRGVRKVVSFSAGWQTDCLAFDAEKFAQFAEKIKVPILAFYGAYDSAWPPAHIKANLAALEKGGKGRGHILAGAGHNVFETHPQLWAPLVFGK